MTMLEPALFLHIPKTAGTSVRSMAVASYGSDNVTSHADHMMLGLQGCADKRFVSGHFGYDFASRLMQGRYSFTFLRDPKARLVSFYSFFRGRTEYTTELYEAGRKYDLVGFLEYCRDWGFGDLVWNNQVWQLAHGFGQAELRDVPLTAAQMEPEALLAQAKRNLARFDAVGLVESFDADITAIFAALGAPGMVPARSNVSDGSGIEAISAAAQAKLDEMTELDQALYAYVRDMRA